MAGILAFTASSAGFCGQDESEPETESPPQATKDQFKVRISPALLEALKEENPAPGEPRLLILCNEDRGRMKFSDPLQAPFLTRPQPIASTSARTWPNEPDAFLLVGDDAEGTTSFPARLDELNGSYRVRAVLDHGHARSHDAPGNFISPITTLNFQPNESQVFELTIDEEIPADPLPAADNLKWVEIPSPMLSKSQGRPIFHRAGVALPAEYDNPQAKRRYWPTIYVIPGFGGDHRSAAEYARLLAFATARNIMPQAVWVVLDPNERLGHHGFADSEAFGPRGQALVNEFIPWLEGRFRLIKDQPEARIVTGHSSGGWSSLWLQLQHPDTFGACFSSAPDPVSFDAFGKIDMYRDFNLFTNAEGEPNPSMRSPMTGVHERVALLIPDEVAMERAIAPDGTSGEQWDTWNAMFSRIDPRTGKPRRAFDSETGMINPRTVEEDWSRFDIKRMISADWPRFAPLFRDRIRLVCGDQDSFYLDGAVRNLKSAVDELKDPNTEGSGYIRILEGANHFDIVPRTRELWFREMREALNGE